MICPPCRDAGNAAREVSDVTGGTGWDLGDDMAAALRGHEDCKGGTWCDCTHQQPPPSKS